MTLAIAVVTADGLVVAADSRTTAPGLPVRVLSDYTHKVFKAGDVALATYGFAFIQGRNIAGHMGEFVREVDEKAGPQEVADRLCGYFGDRLDTHFNAGLDPRPPAGSALGFLVGGYEDHVGKLLEVKLPERQVDHQTDSTTGGAAWRGQTDVMVRLIHGSDGALLMQEAAKLGLEAHAQALVPVLPKLTYNMRFDGMNLQDAIDFAVLCIRTTIDVQRLTYGTAALPGSWPGVGGPIEIAAVTPAEGFTWVQRTTLQGERPAGSAEQI